MRTSLVTVRERRRGTTAGPRRRYLPPVGYAGTVGDNQVLRHDRPQDQGQLAADAVLLVGGKDGNEPLDRAHAVARMDRGEDQVAGLGGRDRRADGVQVANLAHQNDVGSCRSDATRAS